MSRVRRPARYAVVALLAAAGLVGSVSPAAAHRPGPAGSVADSAFLQAADLGGVIPTRPDAGLRPQLRPPRPGPDGRYRSVATLNAEGTVSAVYPAPEGRPTVLIDYVAQYRGHGAARYLWELRLALAGRSGYTDGDGQWTLLRSRAGGPCSLLIRLRHQFTDPDRGQITQDTYLIVARAGHAVVVLADIGWEYGSGHQPIVEALIPAALRRAATVG
ncbi:hypothetical protein [Dactylosporangium matsuzakiense]|uniref:Lipoprotein LpqN n=1 Tax=Dactylosporangium matsuzakiense TaxID=53360 RepID=A0A9W6KRX2_9ACTN|nr:hypothetical protein [Dactylosporangium matsuzakiense]UWZ41401.1 hypothetical protein Dmats_27430 [Dactylosporangium matsuzakiense]GLL06503.1 hypothetical protein GCM10017581_082530 [Dactylosporangium matsuzakiense]